MTTDLTTRTEDELIAMHATADATLADAIQVEMARRAIERHAATDPVERVYRMVEAAHANPKFNPGMDLALALVLMTAAAVAA